MRIKSILDAQKERESLIELPTDVIQKKTIKPIGVTPQEVRELNQPDEAIDKNLSTDRTMPLTTDKAELIRQGKNIPYKDIVNQPVGTVDEETGQATFVDTDRAKKDLLQRDFAKQNAQLPTDKEVGPEAMEFETAEDLRKIITRKDRPTPHANMLNTIINTGRTFGSYLDKQSSVFANDQTQPALKAKEYLIKEGLLGMTDSGSVVFDKKVANGLSVNLVSMIQEYINLKQLHIKDGGFGPMKTKDEVEDIFGKGIDYTDTELEISGDKFNPAYKKGDLAKEVLNLVVKNPYKKEITTSDPTARQKETTTMYSDFGGAGNALLKDDATVFTYLDTVFWSIINDAGYIEAYTGADGDTEYVLTDKAQDFHRSAGSYIKVANKKGRVDVSLTRTEEGMGLAGADRVVGKATGSSIKAKIYNNGKVQAETKGHLGSIDFQINRGMDNIGRQIAEHVIGKMEFKDGMPQLPRDFSFPDANDTDWQVNPNAVMKTKEELTAELLASTARTQADVDYFLPKLMRDQEKQGYEWGTVMFSTSPWAVGLGLDKIAWEEAFRNANRNPDIGQGEAINQANIVMIQKVKSTLIDLNDAMGNISNIFYNKWFDATANGRYHIRNTVLNAQDSKLVRNLLANPNAKDIDLANLDKASREYLDDALYVIGYNLLDGTMTDKVKTSNMGINSVMDATRRVLSRSTPEQEAQYAKWLDRGKLIRDMAGKKNMNSAMIFELETFADKGNTENKNSDLLKDIFTDREEWGFKAQSYIDFANYHDAIEATRKKRKAKQLGKEGIEYITKETPNTYTEADEAQIAQMQDAMVEAKAAGADDEAEQILNQIKQKMSTVSFEEKPLGLTTFKPQALMEIDGKQSGIAIQARQNGDTELLKLVGLMYATEDNVIPFGDIRDLFAEKAEEAIGDLYPSDEYKRTLWSNIFDDIKSGPLINGEKVSSAAVVKELVKQPLMETSYGKSKDFHFESAENFIDGQYGDVILERIKGVSNLMPNYDATQAKNDLKNIIAETLGITLDLDHQQLMKDTGLFFSMLGMTPSFEGPLGNTLWMGSKEFQESGQSITVATSRGNVNVPLGSMKASGNKRSKKTKILDEETKLWRESDPTPYGQEVSNQFPVLSIQVIDAAIMATAINRVNAFRKKKGYQSAKFMLPVHDAIIADATSIKAYHAAVNKAFDDVNDSWHPDEAMADGLNKAYAEKIQSIKDNKIYTVTAESYQWRSLYAYVFNKFKKANERVLKGSNTIDAENNFTNAMTNLGFNISETVNGVPGVKLTGEQLKGILAKVNIEMRLNSRLITQIKKAREARAIYKKTVNQSLSYTTLDTDNNVVQMRRDKKNYTYN